MPKTQWFSYSKWWNMNWIGRMGKEAIWWWKNYIGLLCIWKTFSSTIATEVLTYIKDKLKLTIQNLGWLFNYRYQHCWKHAQHWNSNMQLKTQPRQVLVSLLLTFTLPTWMLACLCFTITFSANSNMIDFYQGIWVSCKKIKVCHFLMQTSLHQPKHLCCSLWQNRWSLWRLLGWTVPRFNNWEGYHFCSCVGCYHCYS